MTTYKGAASADAEHCLIILLTYHAPLIETSISLFTPHNMSTHRQSTWDKTDSQEARGSIGGGGRGRFVYNPSQLSNDTRGVWEEKKVV